MFLIIPNHTCNSCGAWLDPLNIGQSFSGQFPLASSWQCPFLQCLPLQYRFKTEHAFSFRSVLFCYWAWWLPTLLWVPCETISETWTWWSSSCCRSLLTRQGVPAVTKTMWTRWVENCCATGELWKNVLTFGLVASRLLRTLCAQRSWAFWTMNSPKKFLVRHGLSESLLQSCCLLVYVGYITSMFALFFISVIFAPGMTCLAPFWEDPGCFFSYTTTGHINQLVTLSNFQHCPTVRVFEVDFRVFGAPNCAKFDQVAFHGPYCQLCARCSPKQKWCCVRAEQCYSTFHSRPAALAFCHASGERSPDLFLQAPSEKAQELWVWGSQEYIDITARSVPSLHDASTVWACRYFFRERPHQDCSFCSRYTDPFTL